jgi:UDP:flavonoid glycosyltransferase YjiC (YdhE family)
VRFASAPAFEEAIARHGFAFEPIGEDFTWERAAQYFPAIDDAARAGRAMDFAVFDIGWERWHPKAARDLIALVERWRPDVIVRELAEDGATFAGEATGVPVVCASWGALPGDRESWGAIWDWDRALGHYDAIRRDLGLPADEPGAAWRRQPVFSPLPPAWMQRSEGRAPVRHFRVPLAENADRCAPEWLDGMGRERPLVYATLGTVFNKQRRIRAALIEALGRVDADVLMTVGRDVDLAEVGPTPDNVRVEPFVAQSLVLPRASLVVSHAGLGTMLGAIYAGVPMVVVSLGGDQPVNARRAAELGVARALEREEASAEGLATAIDRVRGDERFSAASQALRHECDAMSPVEEAVAVLERVAAGGDAG